MNALARMFGRNTDLVLIALVMGILLVLFAPIPAGLLDFLIVLNISLALLVLLMTFYAPRPVDFSTFPAILLIATLFRLALNVSATRLILSEGDAGQVIAAVGAYVVGGNYVIGLIVFLILVVVQYVVVTNGAQRVSEVAARFTLDSMPGQQMSIDADLNMGFIDQEEAKRRRKILEREGVPCGPINDIAGVFSDPQVIARELHLQLPHPCGSAPSVASPIRLSGTPVQYRSAPPMLGQHTREVLSEVLKLDARDLAELHRGGVI